MRNPGTVLAKFGLRRPFALFVSTLQPRKNAERLIHAYGRLHAREDPGWDLVLAGRVGWLAEPILAAARSSPAAEAIHVLGYVNEEDVAVLRRQAKFFCYPSLHEGFGLPVLEAQSQGVPVLTSNRSSLPEVAGDAALLVDPEDVDEIAQAMLRLSRDEELRTELVAKGHENVKRFSWEKAARETLAVLKRAMNKVLMNSSRPERPAPIDILGVPVHPVDYAGTLGLLTTGLDAEGPDAEGPTRQICTVNPEFIVEARRNSRFRQVLGEAWLNVPDGVGVLRALNLHGCSLTERVTGTDLIPRLAELMRRAGLADVSSGSRARHRHGCGRCACQTVSRP